MHSDIHSPHTAYLEKSHMSLVVFDIAFLYLLSAFVSDVLCEWVHYCKTPLFRMHLIFTKIFME